MISAEDKNEKNLKVFTSKYEFPKPPILHVEKLKLVMFGIFNTFKSTIFITSADVNECQSPDACGANSVCNNTFGSYRCDCANGFVADCGLQNSLNPGCVGKNYINCVKKVG